MEDQAHLAVADGRRARQASSPNAAAVAAALKMAYGLLEKRDHAWLEKLSVTAYEILVLLKTPSRYAGEQRLREIGAMLAAETLRLVREAAMSDAPVADAQSVSTAEDTAKALTLTGSDVAGDGDGSGAAEIEGLAGPGRIEPYVVALNRRAG